MLKCNCGQASCYKSQFWFIIITEKQCSDPGRPKNGDRLGRFKVGSTVRFSCQYGFVLHGSRERTCMESLEWSGSLTTCQDGSKTETHVNFFVTSSSTKRSELATSVVNES